MALAASAANRRAPGGVVAVSDGEGPGDGPHQRAGASGPGTYSVVAILEAGMGAPARNAVRRILGTDR